MGRSIPKVPNVNTRPVIMAPVPLNQVIQWIKTRELDDWGFDVGAEKEKPIFLRCKIQYSNQRFYLRATAGYEREDSAYILLQGKVDIRVEDTLKYIFPDGGEIEYKPLQISHIFDMSGNIFLTKVWVK